MKSYEDRATDMEIALFLARHLDNPCGPSCRENYVKLASRIAGEFENLNASDFLEEKAEMIIIAF